MTTGAPLSQAAELSRAAERWRADGWCLLDGFVPVDAIDAALEEVHNLELPEHDDLTRRADVVGVDPQFRESQFSGTTLFPMPKAPNLNRLFVHPSLVAFARQALLSDDLRIYQSRLWSKEGGRTNYEQPLHKDLNHSLVPTRSDPGYWHLECFLYLSDVNETNGAPRLVPRTAEFAEPASRGIARPEDEPELYAAEVSAPGSRGSLLAYRSDVWHRGTDLQTGSERHILVISFKPSGVDWIGYDAHPPLVNSLDFVVFAQTCTPEELALFGVPLPGHDFWTPDMVEQMALIYPDLDLDPWRAAMPRSGHQ
jgi:hypothetical protein